MNRNQFVKSLASAIVATQFKPGFHEAKLTAVPSDSYPIRFFSKPLDSYDFDFMCEILAECGIGGLDLTVRPGGKIEPEKADTVLPALSDKARKYGLSFDMMVTGFLTPQDPFIQNVLKTASSAGVKSYRLGWFDYDTSAGIKDTIKKYRQALIGIAELNRKFNIRADYQNHIGLRVGGPVWDLYDLLADLPSEYIGIQYDVRHAMVEGASTWPLGLRLNAGRVRSLAIKDFIWQAVDGKPQAVTVPLGEVMVNWDLYFRTVKELNIKGPVTLHIEYPLLDKEQEKLPLLRKKEIIAEKIRKDVVFLKNYLNKYQLI
ncbi:MAG: sugar phosphate isomerase/epimerase [Bacteroidales bacterium]|nr:sugar phosphate isomerase/epimerase [Bacteroidales bacterium]